MYKHTPAKSQAHFFEVRDYFTIYCQYYTFVGAFNDQTGSDFLTRVDRSKHHEKNQK